MVRWPGWSAPLLGGFGGRLAGLSLTGKPHFPFSAPQAMLAGAGLGVLAGLLTWLLSHGSATDEPPQLAETPEDLPAGPSRWPGLGLLIVGLGSLGLNHAAVVYFGLKHLALVAGGAFLASVGLAGLVMPQLLTGGAKGERMPWWVHLVAGAFSLGGLVLAFFLWLNVYGNPR